MTLEQIKDAIKINIGAVGGLRLSKLYPNNASANLWGGMTRQETENFVLNNLVIINSLADNLDVLDGLGMAQAGVINNKIEAFVNSFAQIRTLDESGIASQHHNSLNHLEALVNLLRSTGIYTQLKLAPGINDTTLNKITSAKPVINSVIENKDNISKAIEDAGQWLNTRIEIVDQVIKEQANAFLNRAENHPRSLVKIKSKNIGRFEFFYIAINWWLLGVFIFASMVFFITKDLLTSVEGGVQAGEAILRVSSILIPAYLTVFSANQYLYNKRMHDSYMFKQASLETMNNLLRVHVEDKLQEKIITKGLDVLFSEPTAKDVGKQDKDLTRELLSMLKSQMNQ